MGKCKYNVGDRIGPEKILFVEEIRHKGSNRRGIFECPQCGKHFETEVTHVASGNTRSCGCLFKEILVERNKNNFRDLTGQRFGKLVALKPTEQRQSKNIVWCCQCDCGNIYYASSVNLSRGYTQSCGCIKSKGEQKVSKKLESLDINFEQQKTFKNCKNPETNGQLRFDFYLPDYNTCIEYDGEQHFKSIDYFGGEQRFIMQQENDNIKTQYCKDNNIKLIRIPYTDYDIIDEEYILSRIDKEIK